MSRKQPFTPVFEPKWATFGPPTKSEGIRMASIYKDRKGYRVRYRFGPKGKKTNRKRGPNSSHAIPPSRNIWLFDPHVEWPVFHSRPIGIYRLKISV